MFVRLLFWLLGIEYWGKITEDRLVGVMSETRCQLPEDILCAAIESSLEPAGPLRLLQDLCLPIHQARKILRNAAAEGRIVPGKTRVVGRGFQETYRRKDPDRIPDHTLTNLLRPSEAAS